MTCPPTHQPRPPSPAGLGGGDDCPAPPRGDVGAAVFRRAAFPLISLLPRRTIDVQDEYDWFCDMYRAALTILTIGTVRQIISRNGRLMNEFEVRVGAVPFLSDFLPGLRYFGGLPFMIDGAIMSTANAAALASSSDNDDAAEWELHGHSRDQGIESPILRNLLDSENVSLQSWDLSNKGTQACSTDDLRRRWHENS